MVNTKKNNGGQEVNDVAPEPVDAKKPDMEVEQVDETKRSEPLAQWVEPLNVPGVLCIGIHKKGVLVKSPEALTFVRDLRLVSSGAGMELR